MALTVKILITTTLFIWVMKSVMNTTAVATTGVLADSRLTQVQRDKMSDMTGKSVMKTVGVSLWSTMLMAAVWIWL